MGEQDVHIMLEEYGQIVTSALTESQALLLRERFGRFLDVKKAWEGGYQLQARQYVGVFGLDDVRIIIRPKVPLDNLFYMLTLAYDVPEFHPELALLDQTEDLFEFIVEIFVQQVDKLLRQGMFRAYIDHEQNERYLRGRLLLTEHLRDNVAAPHRLYQRRNEYTADVLENQIVQQTLRLLSRQHFRRSSLRSRVRRTLSAFCDVEPRFVAIEDCDRIIYNRLNERYRNPINLARLLLQHLSLEGRSGAHRFFAFVFDMNQLFERFVARFLERALSTNEMHSVDIQPTVRLDVERQEQGTPDLILRRQDRPILILDTKYKTFNGAPTEADRNQMVTYCHTLGIPQALLIYADAQEPNYDRQFGEVRLKATSLPLNGPLDDFQQRCRHFADTIVGQPQTAVSYAADRAPQCK